MSCDLANGRLEVCKTAVGGIDAIYFVNYGDYTGITYDGTNTDVIDSVAGVSTLYKFELKDFCLNSNDCKTFLGHRYKMVKQVDCKCPNEKNYICGKYCTTDSIACNYFQLLNEIKYNLLNIKNCGNQNSVYMKPYFTLW